MEISQKLKIELPYDPAIPLLGIYLKKIKRLIQKDTRISMFTFLLRYGSNLMSSIDEWIKKIHTHTHTQMKYYSVIRKKIAICSNMDRTGGLYIV